MRTSEIGWALLIALLVGGAWPARADVVRAPASPPALAPAPAPAPALAPAPAEPQRTTATFEDWTLRCVRPERAPALCEVSQVVSNQSQQPVGQTALGRPAKGEAMHLTIMVPSSIQIGAVPRLSSADGEIEMNWRRCLPTGCLADAVVTEEQVRRLRGLKENGRVVYLDGTGREIALPFAPRGLGMALDALGKEAG